MRFKNTKMFEINDKKAKKINKRDIQLSQKKIKNTFIQFSIFNLKPELNETLLVTHDRINMIQCYVYKIDTVDIYSKAHSTNYIQTPQVHKYF